MANPKAAFAVFSAAIAVLALACNRHEGEPDRDDVTIRQRIDAMTEAIRAKDLEAVLPIYAADIVSFDIEPPLQHLGVEGKRKNWTRAFAAYEGPLDYEIRDLTIRSSGDMALVHGLNRIGGTLKNGNRNDYWVRWTACFRKIGGNWRITHDQVSVPLDFGSGKALLTLEPSES
jgi:ketosteroid isomerase-like protein